MKTGGETLAESPHRLTHVTLKIPPSKKRENICMKRKGEKKGERKVRAGGEIGRPDPQKQRVEKTKKTHHCLQISRAPLHTHTHTRSALYLFLVHRHRSRSSVFPLTASGEDSGERGRCSPLSPPQPAWEPVSPGWAPSVGGLRRLDLICGEVKK